MFPERRSTGAEISDNDAVHASIDHTLADGPWTCTLSTPGSLIAAVEDGQTVGHSPLVRHEAGDAGEEMDSWGAAVMKR